MNFSPIIIVGGEPQSIFLEIFLKAIKKKSQRPIILVSSKEILKKNMEKFKKNLKLNILNRNYSNIKKGCVNLVDIMKEGRGIQCYDNIAFSRTED